MGIRVKAGKKSRRTYTGGDPLKNVVTALERLGFNPKVTGPESWESVCPVHVGDRKNLSVSKGDNGAVILHRHAHGCTPECVVAALGMEMADLFPPRDAPHHGSNHRSNGKAKSPPKAYATVEDAIAAMARHLGPLTGAWPYQDAVGAEIARVVRFDPPGEKKQYRPIHRDPETGRWKIADPPGQWPLYHLPELAGAARVYFVEGEKCGDLVRHLGLIATTTAHGSKSPHKSDLAPLSGTEVIILPDLGEAGEAYADALVGLLAALDPRPTVKIVKLPGLTENGSDIEQWLAIVPDGWEPEQCRAELDRLADTAPAVDFKARVEGGDDDDAWPPLRLGKLPAVEPFPIDVFPDPVARLVHEASGAVGCDPGLAGGPTLAIAGGLIGRSASLLMGHNWFASSSIFEANVAVPGDGKSPCAGYVRAAVEAIEQELAEEFKSDKQSYQDECKATPKNKPDTPIPRRLELEDSTLEAAFRILAPNPRGLVMCYDELATLILGMGQYKRGGGNDAPNLMKIWAGASVVIDRVSNEMGEPIRIPHPCLSITGNLPPVNLADMVNRRGDVGFLDCWLYVFPDRRPKLKSSQRHPVSDDALKGWSDVCRALWNRVPNVTQDGRACPHVVRISEVGRREFDRLHDDHVDEVNSQDFPEALRGPWAKLEEYAGRLCFVLTMLRHAADAVVDPHSLPEVGPDLARDAWWLINYFKSQHRRVRAALEGKGVAGAPEGVRLILNWTRNHPEADAVPESELTRTYPRFRDDRAMMEDGLRRLEQRNALRSSQKDQPAGKPGRKPAPLWEIHPDLRRTENPENG